MAEAVAAGCAAVMEMARERPDDPQILEVSLDLGKLQGTWAEVYRRREDLTAKHARKVAKVWRKLVKRLDPDQLVARYRRDLLMAESAAAGKPDDKQKAAARGSALWWLSEIMSDPEFRDLSGAVTEALAAGLAEGKAAALAIAADEASALGFDWAAAYARMYAGLTNLSSLPGMSATWVQDIIGAAAADAGRALAKAAAAGKSDAEMIAAVMDEVGGADPESVALMVDYAMGGSFARGALDLYASEGVLVGWMTASDGRVCFPAGTPVMTPDGERPIEALRSGDLVITPQGELPVHCAGSRPYAGALTVLHTERRTVAATDDHPFWTPSGWREAGQIKPGDLVHALDDERAEVRSAVHLVFAKPDDVPAGARKLRVAPGISGDGSGVPVLAVSLNGDLPVDDGEVDRPAADRAVFLLEIDPEAFKGDSNSGLKPGLPAEAAITGEAAELPVRGTGNLPETLAAIPAREEHGRPPAFLGAEMPAEPLRVGVSEFLPASLAVHVDSVGVLAGERADVIAVGDGGVHREVLAACGTVLGDSLGAAADVVAFPATERPVVLLPTPAQVKAPVAARASPVGHERGGVVAVSGAESPLAGYPSATHELLSAVSAFIGERHDGTSSDLYVTGIRGIPVYDIEVEKAHVFYASGFLVHNCGDCYGNEDNGPYDPAAFPACPAHPRCRCIPYCYQGLPLSAFADFLITPG